MGISWLVSLLQTLSAIAIVSVVALVLGRGGFTVLRDSRRIELVCYGLIALIGLAMLAGALREAGCTGGRRAARVAPRAGRGSSPPGSCSPPGSRRAPARSSSCCSPFGQELYLVGVAACLVMAVGMGLTVSLVGLAAVAARRGTVRVVGPSAAAAHWVKAALGVRAPPRSRGWGDLFLSAWAGV